jgi:16S rRNA C967 or C1407 C5-methylase (RsmB/RsmF family)/NOL1/NOP2/fmu family ribosome biogenesis protein
LKILPPPLLDELKYATGYDEQSFIRAHQQPPVISIRQHPVKGKDVFHDYNKISWIETGRYLHERPVFTLDPLFHAGAYYVQEASSMFLDYLLRQTLPSFSNLHVLDLCAAPGGKSTLLASMLKQDSLLISNEVIRSRASILEENMTRWGYMNTWVTSNDARDFGRLSGYFDVIVVDAPCSGSGLFRKDEDALKEWSEANVNLCSQRQQRILADVWPSLKEDGYLVYATCSFSPQEDEEILDWLAETYNVRGINVPIPEGSGIVLTNSTKHHIPGYRFYPDKVQGEGFFIGILQKKESTPSSKPVKFKSQHQRQVAAQADHLLGTEDWICLTDDKKNYYAIHPSHEEDIHQLKGKVFLRKTGTMLGMPSAKEWVPAHDLALCIHLSTSVPAIEVNKEQALKLLKKEDVALHLPDKGWYIVTYKSRSLCWIKSLGNRYNNYLPVNARIRMDISDSALQEI